MTGPPAEALDAEHPDATWGVPAEVPAEVADLVRSLPVDGDASAYLFRCLRCGRPLAYGDAA